VQVPAKQDATATDPGSDPSGNRAVNHAAATLARNLEAAIFATSPGLRVGPDAAELPLLLAARVVATRRVAPIHAAVARPQPARCAEQFKLLPLPVTEPVGVQAVQVATAAHHPTETTSRSVAWRDLHVCRGAAALLSACRATITIAAARRLATACKTTALPDAEATPFRPRAQASTASKVPIAAPTSLLEYVHLDYVTGTPPIFTCMLLSAHLSMVISWLVDIIGGTTEHYVGAERVDSQQVNQ